MQECRPEPQLLPMDRKIFRLSKKQAICLAGLTVAVIGGIILFLLLRQSDPPRNLKRSSQPSQRLRVEGLRFYGMKEGRRVIAIEADRFVIQKGKIGFFSTGLTQTVRIENARIDLYAAGASTPGNETKPLSAQASPDRGPASRETSAATSGGVHQAREPTKSSLAGSSPGGKPTDRPPAPRWNFGDLFAGETFSSLLPTKNLSAIEAAPVMVRLHGSSALQTRIEASRASVRFRERDILFEGNVRVSAKGAELETEQLVFVPETACLKTDKPYILKKGDRTIEGTHLVTDLLLQPQ